jgi:predicted DNA-binding transcriptional regulator YafY
MRSSGPSARRITSADNLENGFSPTANRRPKPLCESESEVDNGNGTRNIIGHRAIMSASMSQTERVLRIQQMLQAQRVVSREQFLGELEVSLATFKRDLEFLRSRFQVNIEWSRERGGYYCEDLRAGGGRGNIPGPMYSATEIHALLLMQDLLIQLQPGLLEIGLAPLRQRLQLLLGTKYFEPDQIRRRIRILHMASRPVDAKCFQLVSMATLSRRRLHLTYLGRFHNEDTVREVSPQRLVYYRANWYLDAWCHLRNGLRSFALDMIRDVKINDTPADEIPDEALDANLGSGYGIFTGAPQHTAVLRFEPHVTPGSPVRSGIPSRLSTSNRPAIWCCPSPTPRITSSRWTSFATAQTSRSSRLITSAAVWKTNFELLPTGMR